MHWFEVYAISEGFEVRHLGWTGTHRGRDQFGEIAPRSHHGAIEAAQQVIPQGWQRIPIPKGQIEARGGLVELHAEPVLARVFQIEHQASQMSPDEVRALLDPPPDLLPFRVSGPKPET